MRTRSRIRSAAWSAVVLGASAPIVRRRVKLPPAGVLAAAASAPVALNIAMKPSRVRDVATCALQMWAYLAAYELPHDDPEKLAARVHVGYPVQIDRALGLGQTPTQRLQHRFATPGRIKRLERVMVWSHWMWFAVPHGSVAYVMWRDPERFPSAAARMYSVFDIGASFYWAFPTAPPWWAAKQGRLGEREVRRMMIEYGEEYWGDRWPDLVTALGGNPLAAMPSLHFATSVMAAHLLSETGPVAGAVAWTYASVLGLALVYLGEHYAADLIGGALLTETVRTAAPAATPAARVLRDALARLEARTRS